MEISVVNARTLDEAHFLALRKVFEKGRVYVIQKGSYEGNRRLELPMVNLRVTHPFDEPRVPQVPPGVSPPTDREAVEKYFQDYLFSGEMQKNEMYTYGQYIASQLGPVIQMLRLHGPGTNQATITIGGTESVHQEHPPCLRLIDCRVMDGKLHFVVYFRSWDCWAGLPENLGGLQLLKEYMAGEVGVGDGEIVAVSKGLHVYDYQWPSVFARLGNTLPEGCPISEKEAEAGEKWMLGEEKD